MFDNREGSVVAEILLHTVEETSSDIQGILNVAVKNSTFGNAEIQSFGIIKGLLLYFRQQKTSWILHLPFDDRKLQICIYEQKNIVKGYKYINTLHIDTFTLCHGWHRKTIRRLFGIVIYGNLIGSLLKAYDAYDAISSQSYRKHTFLLFVFSAWSTRWIYAKQFPAVSECFCIWTFSSLFDWLVKKHGNL